MLRKLSTITAAAALLAAVGFSGAAQAEIEYSFDGDLVAYFSFDASNGSLDATDDSGNSNDGTVTDAVADCVDTPTTAMNSCSADFDGTNDSVGVTTPTFVDDSQGTLTAWFKLANPSINTSQVIASTSVDGSTDDEFLLQWQGNAAGDPIRVALLQNGAVTLRLDGDTGITDTDWHHVAATSDGIIIRLYVDGVLQTLTETNGTNTGQWFDDATDADTYTIGGVLRASLLGDFSGNIDEVRVYSVVLTDDQIALLASGGVESDPYADEVASFVLPAGCLTPTANCDTTGDDNDQGTDALEAPDHDEHDSGGDLSVSTFTSLGFDSNTLVGGILTLNFTDNTCLDGDGDDIKVYEVSHLETFDVDIGLQGGSLTNINTDIDGDESEAGLSADGVTPFNQVRLEATSGLAIGTDGPDIDAVECLNSLNFSAFHIEKTNTGLTEIDVGAGVPQVGFEFTITIWNNTGSNTGLEDIIFRDVVPGEFDLDPPEAPLDDNGCTVELNHPAGAVKKNLEKLEPEFIDIDAGGLLNGQSCTITVGVKTDEKNFPHGRSPGFTPTSCDTTITLNEGVEVFLDDGDDPGEVDKNDTLLFVDDDSLELTCNFPS